MGVRMKDLPGGERPRERLARVGLEALADRELLALLLRSGGSDLSALEVADLLLAEHGSLEGLARARPEELEWTSSVGEAKAAGLAAAFELGRRVLGGASERPTIRGPGDIARLVGPRLAVGRQETVLVLVINGANRLVRTLTLTMGASDRCLLPTWDTVAAVLRHDGKAFAVAHNHPSGDLRPSAEDVRATRALGMAATAAGLRFLDHVIVAGDDWMSLSEMRSVESGPKDGTPWFQS